MEVLFVYIVRSSTELFYNCHNHFLVFHREIQRGRVKCGRYWPDSGAFGEYNDLEVSCLEETGKDDFITRQFLMNNTKVF